MKILMLLAALGATLYSREFPVPEPESRAFVAPLQEGDPGSLWILSPAGLTVYRRLQPDHRIDLPFEAGVSAVDLYDIDNDGILEIVFVQGDAIRRYEIVDDTVRGPDTLFTRPSRLADAHSGPFLHTLAVPMEDTVVIALPTEDALSLCRLDGTETNTFAVGQDAAPQVVFGRPFTQWSSIVSELGSADALEFRVSRVEAFKPRLPAGALPWPTAAPIAPDKRLGSTRDLNSPPDRWPSFGLQRGISNARAAYLTTGAENFETVLRVGTADDPTRLDGPVSFGPERRYPGRALVPADAHPDFNVDGYTDLLLWRTSRPGFTVDALSRAAAGERWPIFLSVHLFTPEKMRYNPRPAGRIRLEVPITWFLTPGMASPVQHVVLEDFDGDGRTDLGLSSTPKTYTVWLYGDDGIATGPSLEVTLAETLKGIAFKTPSPEGKGILLGLETENTVHVIRPVVEPG